MERDVSDFPDSPHFERVPLVFHLPGTEGEGELWEMPMRASGEEEGQ